MSPLPRVLPTVRLVVVIAAFIAVSPAAQQPTDAPQLKPSAEAEQPQARPPRFRTEANYVRVDVYPTRDGKPVQGLTKEDFEVLEDGSRQTVDAFEHVVISPAGPQASRTEPGSVREAEQMATDSRARVFVFFIDPAHVWFEGAHAVKEPLIRLMDRLLGPTDLIAVMTPAMSASDVTFARKTDVMAAMLRLNWSFGGRMTIVAEDDQEREYEQCFSSPTDGALVTEMILRRRERVALDALHDLVRYLGGVREERKAVVAVTNGWRLYRPNPQLLVPTAAGVPGTPPIGVDEVGKLRVNPPRRDRAGAAGDQSTCERERMHLAQMDNEEHFRRLIDSANRSNASFYPIDPRRLEVFESPLVADSRKQASLSADRAQLMARLDVLRTMADGTDGLAVVNTNDLEAGVRRIADDLSSYYLLGYYSSNARLDGGYRRITVRVKQPGVDVRARRGYRAATAEDVNAARRAAAPIPESARAASAAVGKLAAIRAEAPLALHAVVAQASADRPGRVWVAGQLQPSAKALAGGATVDIALTGGTAGTGSALVKPGQRTFLIDIPVAGLRDDIEVRVRVTSGGAAIPASEVVRVGNVSEPQAMPFRRSPFTGNRLEPAPDFHFSRTERVVLEVPVPAAARLGVGKLLDRNGQALQVPVQVGERTDGQGQRWLTASVTLAALGAGDYLVEAGFADAGTERTVLTAIRVTR